MTSRQVNDARFLTPILAGASAFLSGCCCVIAFFAVRTLNGIDMTLLNHTMSIKETSDRVIVLEKDVNYLDRRITIVEKSGGLIDRTKTN